MDKKQRCVVILSGGVDSMTLLYCMLKMHHETSEIVSVLSFNYGQRHVKELERAKEICREVGLSHKVVDITAVQQVMGGSALTDSIEIQDDPKVTVVPNRNMIMLSIAIAEAISNNCDVVLYGAHKGDHAVYPDCRPEFARGMNSLALAASGGKVKVAAPFMYSTKDMIIQMGMQMGIDYSKTWTCYKGRDEPCGVCPACTEREKAFDRAGVPDPARSA